MRVRLEKPTVRLEKAFLCAVRRSRALHRGTVSPPSTPEAYRSYVASLRKRNREGFFVSVTESGELAGVVNVGEIVRGPFLSAYLGYYAFVPLAGTGLMREGLELVVRHCFRVLRLHRLEANIQPHNRRSIALAAGLGFRLEGLSPRYLKVCGRWRDHERWALLAEDWRALSRA